ncbi:universal stress protein [Pseudomonas laurentiana]|uniref:Universal stress protein n=1 Tax=Pseudomonas laurentiana TaxID=2364649 RepID=A0A6I5RMT5_9PSED|nr:universal stress protein [Pseudomonas laurentiana]NES08995.1 universal stress protein [Pseudomonas laurentiana]GGU73841.1 universal stress protein [Pseudomonas laurentiana]
MSMQKRLMLVSSPLMKAGPAFDRAAALAKARDEPLHIVAFDYVEGLATAGLVNDQALQQMREGYVERHRAWLEDQARPMRKIGVEVTTEVVWAEQVLPEILVHLREEPIDLVVKEVEHESRLMRAMFTTLDVHLLRECKVPLHFVCKTRNALPRKIVAAVDPFHPDDQYTGFNDRIIYEALKLAMQCKAEMHLLYAHDLSSMGTGEYGFSTGSMLFSSSLAQKVYDIQGNSFNELAERNGIPAENRHMIVGNPAKVLASFAETREIDVIVMGRVHRRGASKSFGSTVEDVLYRMPSSVLVITPEDFVG